MGKSSSVDLRVRIIGEIESGGSCRSAARRFGVSAATAVRLAQRKARTGSVAPARQGRPKGSGMLGGILELGGKHGEQPTYAVPSFGIAPLVHGHTKLHAAWKVHMQHFRACRLDWTCFANRALWGP